MRKAREITSTQRQAREAIAQQYELLGMKIAAKEVRQRPLEAMGKYSRAAVIALEAIIITPKMGDHQ